MPVAIHWSMRVETQQTSAVWIHAVPLLLIRVVSHSSIRAATRRLQAVKLVPQQVLARTSVLLLPVGQWLADLRGVAGLVRIVLLLPCSLPLLEVCSAKGLFRRVSWPWEEVKKIRRMPVFQ